MVHFKDLQEATQRLGEALHQEKNEFVRDSAILRFELCAEMAWKTMRDYLKAKGQEYNTPLDVVREAFKAGLIDYDNDWIKLIKDRNIVVHTYDLLKADDLYLRLSKYLKLFTELIKKLEAVVM